MEFAQLGKSGIQVSRIAFGCMSLQSEEKASERLIHQAIANGINFFDTADLYDKGKNEILVGGALKGKRQEVVLATKVGNQWRPDGSGWDWNPRKAYILREAEESLKRLGTDYIDLYQLHGGTMNDPWEETIEAFELLKSQGKIRAYGISSIRPNVIRNWTTHAHISSVMMQYSLLDRRPEETCLTYIKEHQISVLVRGSVAQGLLVSKPAKPYLNYSTEEVERMAKAIKQISTSERSAAQTAIRYTLQHPAITSVVVGMRTEEQLTEAVQVLNTPPLNRNEMESLKSVLPPNVYTDHRS
jgi:aryl-alcohol dehydrogenase-like predicted oxidoreductase